MRKFVFTALAGCLAAGLASTPWALLAAEPAKPADKPADKAAPPITYDAPNPFSDLSDLRDAAFDRYVDLVLLGRAWRDQDAAALTDAALQLAEGERVLLRTHKAGLTAERVLGLAERLAEDKMDKASLERVGKAAQARGDQKLAAAVALAAKAAGASRDLDPALLMPADTTTPEEFTLFRSYLKDIRAAKVSGDAVTLEAIQGELPGRKELAPERRDYLKNLLKEAIDTKPAADPDAAKLNKALDKLAMASRGGFLDQVSDAAAELDKRRLQGANDVSNDFATMDPHLERRLRPAPRGPDYVITDLDDTNYTPPPPPKQLIRRDFTIWNKCPYPVRVQCMPGGQPYPLAAGAKVNWYWQAHEPPSIIIVKTGRQWALENANFQIAPGVDGDPEWSYAP